VTEPSEMWVLGGGDNGLFRLNAFQHKVLPGRMAGCKVFGVRIVIGWRQGKNKASEGCHQEREKEIYRKSVFKR